MTSVSESVKRVSELTQLSESHEDDADNGLTERVSHLPGETSSSVTRTRTYDDSPSDQAKCIRRPGSVWSACKCPPCRAHNARLNKLSRNGWNERDRIRDAIARVQSWMDAGYSCGAIASMIGMHPRAAQKLTRSVREGRTFYVMRHSTAHAILAAVEVPHRGFLPAFGVTRRLQALAAIGWPAERLADECGVPRTTLDDIRNGRPARCRVERVRAVAAMYERLCMTPGPSAQSVSLAKARGWVPPLAWEHIDNPAEEPNTGDAPSRAVVDLADVEHLASFGLDFNGVGERIGVKGEAVERALLRADRQDLLGRLRRNRDGALRSRFDSTRKASA